jgi:hypothetical protein
MSNLVPNLQYTRSSNGWVEARSDDRFPPSPILALRCRRLDDGSVVRVYLSSGHAVDVVWDTVLMACEPAYEHFGGLTEESRIKTFRYWNDSAKHWFTFVRRKD